MKTVSVIVPIYNVERYLERCLTSIMNQSYKNIQIILVNDGSTDKSGLICSQFAKKDSRIEIITKENGGLSDARNYGMMAAKGNYLTFIDSDDFVELDYVEYLVYLLEKNKADISIVSYRNFKDNKHDVKSEFENQIICYNAKDALRDLLYQKQLSTSACAKLYRKELFDGICFPKGKLYEDVNTIYKLFHKSKKIIQSTSQKYYYCIRNDSIVHSEFNPRKYDYVNNCKEVMDFILYEYPELYNAAISRYLWANIHVWVNIDKPAKYSEIYREVNKNIKRYRSGVLMDTQVPLKIKATILLSYLGWRVSRSVYLMSKKI